MLYSSLPILYLPFAAFWVVAVVVVFAVVTFAVVVVAGAVVVTGTVVVTVVSGVVVVSGDVLPVLKLFRNTSFPGCRYRKVDKPASEGDGK